ncbi:hypothetical protein ACIQ34_00030 [Ureibacillus sp. NPDC094379]
MNFIKAMKFKKRTSIIEYELHQADEVQKRRTPTENELHQGDEVQKEEVDNRK